MSHHELDSRLATRFVDGELRGEELVAFERRLLAEPGLREAVEEQREVRRWFAERRREEAAPGQVGRPRRGFAAAVLERTRRLPSRGELREAAESPLAEEIAAASKLAVLLSIAAAAVLGLSMLVWSGMIKRPDPRHLQASDMQAVERIDRAIEADALRRDAERGR